MRNIQSTLMLNADFQPMSMCPLSTVPWQTAITQWFKQRVYIVKEHENWVVRSPSVKALVPSVVAIKKYRKKQEAVKFSSKNVFIRDRFECQYCGEDFTGRKELLTMDHVLPKSAGGKTTWENLVACCSDCNIQKDNRLDWKKPKRRPFKPTYYDMQEGFRMSSTMDLRDEAWRDYVSWPEENVRVIPVPNTRRPGEDDDIQPVAGGHYFP